MIWFFSLLWYWLTIFFIIPFKDLEVLWILIPIWVNLIISDFFQEKRGTSLGNAISNGSVMLWVGIDWIRFQTRTFVDFNGLFALKVVLSAVVFAFGTLIIVEGIKGQRITKYIGRVRETSYVMLVLSPLVYNLLEPTWQFFLSIILFAPLFYVIFEMVDRLIPDPKSIQEEENRQF